MKDIAKDRADWLLDAVACATQNRQFLRGEDEYDSVAGEAILLGAEKAINVAMKAVIEDMRAWADRKNVAELCDGENLYNFTKTLKVYCKDRGIE